MLLNILFLIYSVVISAEQNYNKTSETHEGSEIVTHNPSRRILRGRPVGETRPYMVYLRAAVGVDPKITDTNWLCGGVIIHERFILTSAACIEDAKQFYVVSGTHKWIPPGEKNSECINNGAKKAIWKCVPNAYFFDGDDFDNIRWMVGDIAVVKVEDNFNFERRIRGCDFIPKKVYFNNRTKDLEKSGTIGSIAGWGTTETFGDVISRFSVNSQELLETDVVLISKKACKKHWDPRYHFIIDDYMVCSKDTDNSEVISARCAEHEINCKELVYSDEDEKYIDETRRMILPSNLEIDTAAHIDSRRKEHHVTSGGFCENDHGGPLIVGEGKSSVVVGIMSACLTKEITHKCYGPFLYTSVYNYRNLISCAINNYMGLRCKNFLRSSNTSMTETTFDWSGHPDGRSKPLKHQKDDAQAKVLLSAHVTQRPQSAKLMN